MSIFEKASRLNLRFSTSKGQLTTEDLWGLPLTTTKTDGASLDNLARSLNKQIKEIDTESFVTPATKTDEALQLRFDIVKHVIAVRQTENATALAAKARADQKQKLLELRDRKQNAQLESLSLEEIDALLASA